MNCTKSITCLIIICAISACQISTSPLDEEAIKETIVSVLDQQVLAWNQGDVEKFLVGYHRSETLRFASGGNVHYGWRSLLSRYKTKYPDKAAMGNLTFSERDIQVLSEEAALVFGKWQLDRETDVPYGYFTLIFRKTTDGWKITHDHTSSAETN